MAKKHLFYRMEDVCDEDDGIIGYALYIDNEYVGKHIKHSCGLYSESTGIFAETESDSPIWEWCKKNNVLLYDEDTSELLPRGC